MANWERSRLGDLVETQKGYAFKSGWYCGEGRPIVKVSDFTGDSVDSTALVCIPEETAISYLRYELRAGDVVVQTVGSWPTNPASVVGKCVRIPGEVAGALLNQNAVKLTPANGFDRTFLFYLLRNEEFKIYIIGTAQGAASQAAITLDAIRGYKFPLPPLPIQRRIAGILSAYDALIENSQRRIRILEAMARALYREGLGFGSISAANQPIIESPYWRFISENVGRYSGTKRYYATADINGLAITGQGIDYSFAEKPSRAQKEPILNSVWFARMKDTYKIAWYGPLKDERVSGVMLSSGFAGFEAQDSEMWPLLFLTISSKEFHVQKDLYCTGATQMSLTNEGLARISMPLPGEDAARWLGRKAGPILSAIAGLQQRNNNLRRTRDLLLPRLLSGQIDVEALDHA